MKNKLLKFILAACLLAAVAYGAGRLYFSLTEGFRIAHISSELAYNPRWDTRSLSLSEEKEVDKVLSQKFTYLGKGCQSYVFLSDDGEYVIKFLKYQRFRPQCYFYWFSFLPKGEKVLNDKLEKKKYKQESLFASWRTAFDFLQPETGLVYVHLNKSSNLNKQLTIFDKLGVEHTLNLDDMEFLVQRRADMLCSTIDAYVAEGKSDEAKGLLSDLINMVVNEYRRGFADHDHALMQNTGVCCGKPVHIDVGQFEKNDEVRDPGFYHQELFNKTWKFRRWLRKKHPDLLTHVDKELVAEMGDKFYSTTFIPKR